MNDSTLAAIISFLAIPVSLLIKGYVFALAWTWFLVPIGAPAVSIPVAIGIILIAWLVTPSSDNEAVHTPEEVLERVVKNAIFKPLFMLLLAWFVTLFM